MSVTASHTVMEAELRLHFLISSLLSNGFQRFKPSFKFFRSLRSGRDSQQPSLRTLRGPQVGSSRVADRLLQSVGQVESLQRPLPGDLALWGGVGAQGLGGADQQRLRRGLVGRGQAVSRAGPLCAISSGGGVVDELGGLLWSGGGRRVA